MIGAGGSPGAGGAGQGGGAYSYDFTETVGGVTCETQHDFATLADMCAGLESDSFNQNCALAARQKFFPKYCPGTFQETP